MEIKRKFYSLEETEVNKGVSASDLIHGGETGQVQLYINSGYVGHGWAKSQQGEFLLVPQGDVSSSGIFPLHKLQVSQIRRGEPIDCFYREDIIPEVGGELYILEHPIKYTMEDVVILADDLKKIMGPSNEIENKPKTWPDPVNIKGHLLKGWKDISAYMGNTPDTAKKQLKDEPWLHRTQAGKPVVDSYDLDQYQVSGKK